MALEQLELTNFTAFDHISLEFSPGVNVLIGTNATGKTHVLKAAYAMLKGLTDPDAPRELPDAARHFVFRLVHEFGSVFRPRTGDLGILTRIGQDQDAKIGIRTASGRSASWEIVVGRESASRHSGTPTESFAEDVTFIPSRDVLSFYPGFVAANESRELSFDATYVDLCRRLSAAPLKRVPASLSEVADSIESLISAKVELKQDRFFFEIRSARSKDWVDANLIAEGHRKLATICQLIRNGGIRKGSVLLLDEPEASLNPQLAGPLASHLCDLAAAGVQVILATHDYALATRLSLEAEFNTKAGAAAELRFHGLYRETPTSSVLYESGATMADLKHNAMLDEFATLYDHEQELFRRAAQ